MVSLGFSSDPTTSTVFESFLHSSLSPRIWFPPGSWRSTGLPHTSKRSSELTSLARSPLRTRSEPRSRTSTPPVRFASSISPAPLILTASFWQLLTACGSSTWTLPS